MVRACPLTIRATDTQPLLLFFSISSSSSNLFLCNFVISVLPPIMSSVLSSQGVALATAMVVSCTAIYLAFSSPKPIKTLDSQPPSPNLRSCLCKDDQRKRRNSRKKKRVQFAESVKETEGNGEEYRRARENNKNNSNTRIQKSCRNEFPETQKIPANRAALYNGILRDRVHRLQCSY
ncbi:hypothetical protein HS088_TW10G00743 [Tripterygium wilfordii]|uniref:Uncharacterized protein n=1 Tax=Tripterygium wilfordii TaxID=458696 RepID=A0A7J7D608_TRIWF|nr:uncharacterized protein LOC120007102 [Tripterygium wilfordii]XP_038713213.1 uncharacterized protein LOC120007102 [Tripterygium wilfordii]KAF5741738.1 hypothetical protein HS088_TW10G00743 [Tripterygium wilfordii]